MNSEETTFLVLLVLGFIFLLGLAVWLPKQAMGRWGTTRVNTNARGEGAYREGVLSRDLPRKIPERARFLAIALVIWGGLTFFVFSPAGGIFALFFAEQVTWVSFFVLQVVISGFIVGGVTIAMGFAMLAGRDWVNRRATAWGMYGVFHHIAVIACFVAAALVADDLVGVAVFTLVACSFGALLSIAQMKVGKHLQGLQATSSDAPLVPDTSPSSLHAQETPLPQEVSAA